MTIFFKYINQSSKNKLLCFSGLMLSTSIICPLTSCGSDGTSNDIGGFDKEFGFDAQTYDRLERQFTSKYGASLKEKDIDKDAYINKFNNFLQNDLAILRNKLFDPVQNYSFTVRTNTLMDYASKNYNIYLNRDANVSDIDFENLKLSSLENFVIYMENMGFPKAEIDEKKVEFNNKFDAILKDCKSKIIDNAQILMQLRANVVDCWQNLNDELAYLSAYNHLKKFFDENEFAVRDQKNNYSYLWDKLLFNSSFMGGNNNKGKIDQDINLPILDHWIKDLFIISDISKRNKEKDTQTNDTSSDITENYNKTIISGFILTPVLKTMSQDIYSNNYYINIDWQLMPESYQNKDQETRNKATAHLATTKDGKVVDYTDSKDGQLSSDKYQFTRYSLKATPNYQQEKMIQAYFDQTKELDQKITFGWNKDMFGIDYFLPSDAKKQDFVIPDKPYNVPMARNNLSLIGLQLNGTNLSDLLNKQNNLQDNQSNDETNNDDNLKIEEKFVKYCDIKSNAIVSFSDNVIGKNTIQNSFTASFTNTDTKCDVETKSNVSNIGPSKFFSNNAVNFYNQVVNYVDSKKILDDTESRHWLTASTNIGLYILFGVIFVLLIWTVFRYNFLYFHGGAPVDQDFINDNVHKDDLKMNLINLFFLCVNTLIVFAIWKIRVSDPISAEVDDVKKWNDTITNRSQSSKKINVIEKVNGEDKENFESIDNFVKYYEKNSNSAFASYFYYFHFVELSQNQSNNEQLTTINEDVKNDYDDFNRTKEGLNIGNRDIDRNVIACFGLLIAIHALIIISVNIYLTIKIASKLIRNIQVIRLNGIGGQQAQQQGH